ncbi:MAG: Rha family transcriptional regulator [Helicobacteraceae bacterium]|jgi:Rha family phage regulatory protein|nr:Rha family transcriptional regulator [Helicobacteraceae bacterium]
MLPQSNVVVINNREVVFAFKGEKPFISSRDLAAVFEKRHADVIRAIDALPQDEYRQRNFAFTFYQITNPKGGKPIEKPMYKLTRDGFALLAMGFTGEKAHKWKIAFIEGFNKMEAELKNRASADSSALNRLVGVIERQAATFERLADALDRKDERSSEPRESDDESDEFVIIKRAKPRKLSAEEKALIEFEYSRGASAGETARKLKRNHSTVRFYLLERGLLRPYPYAKES